MADRSESSLCEKKRFFYNRSKLTAKEYSLLEYLAVNSGRVLSLTSDRGGACVDQSFEANQHGGVYIRQLRRRSTGTMWQSLISYGSRAGIPLSEQNETKNALVGEAPQEK